MAGRLGVEGRVGPNIASDGTEEAFRLGRDLSLIVADGHGSNYEACSRGRIFSAMTSPAGTTIVAANVTPIAAAAASILSIYNPASSGINVEILKTWLNFISGTPGAGAFVYNVAFAQNISALSNNQGVAGTQPIPNLPNGGVGTARCFVQTALTGGTGAQILLRPIGATLFAAALSATSPVLSFYDPVDGEIVLPPGALLSIAAPAVGTTVLLAAGITFQEVPLLSPVG